MPTDLELAWISGLIEADGYIGMITVEGGKRKRYSIAVEMIDEDAVRRCHQLTGKGNVIIYDRKGGQWKRTWKWQVQSKKDVVEVLNLILPFVYTARRKARILEVLDSCNTDSK